MTYKENTPTFNVNRSVVNFNDFCKTCEEPKLKKMKRQRKPNTADTQQHIGNFNQKFNPVTRKIDNLSPVEVDDRLDQLKESTEDSFGKYVDTELLEKIESLPSFTELKDDLKVAVDKFEASLDEIGYDKNNKKHYRAFITALGKCSLN